MGSKAPSKTTQTTISTPSLLEKTLSPYLTNLYQAGQTETNRALAQPFDPLETQGRDRLLSFVNNLLPNYQNQFKGLQGQVAGYRNALGGYKNDIAGLQEFARPGQEFALPLQSLIAPFDPQNEITQNFLKAALDPIRKEFTETLRPQLSSQDVLTQGGVGGTRGQVLQAQLGERYLDSLGRTSSNILAQQQNQQNQLAAQIAQLLEGQRQGRVGTGSALTGQLAGITGQQAGLAGQEGEFLNQRLGLDQLGPQLLSSLGEQNRTRNFDILQRFAQLLSGAGSGGGAAGPQTTTTTSTGGSRAAGGIGGLAVGTGLAAGLKGLGGLGASPVTGGLSLLIPSLLGAFG